MRKILFILFFAIFAYALDDIPSEFNATKEAQLSELNASLAFIEDELADNIWATRYSNYNTFQKLSAELDEIEAAIKKQAKNQNEITIKKIMVCFRRKKRIHCKLKILVQK